jgi:hypothetical protein
MRVGIAIEGWKLPVFDKHLTSSGYGYETNPGLSANTLLLIVITNSSEALAQVVRAANDECAAKGKENCKKLH